MPNPDGLTSARAPRCIVTLTNVNDPYAQVAPRSSLFIVATVRRQTGSKLRGKSTAREDD